LQSLGEIRAVSQAYQSAAAGPAGQPDFVNAAALLETDLSPAALHRELRRIEADLGRRRSADRYAARSIDLDLVLYNDLIEETEDMVLPDPDLLRRPYLAQTMAEVDPGAIHPVTGVTLAENARLLGGASGLTRRPDIALPRPAAPPKGLL